MRWFESTKASCEVTAIEILARTIFHWSERRNDMPGALNKANSRQHSSNKASYEMQKQRTARNKERNIKRQKRLIERTKRREANA